MNLRWTLMLGALALAVPMPPLQAGENGLPVSTCGQPGIVVRIPMKGDPAQPKPGDNGCCPKACHAGCERRDQTGKRKGGKN